MVRIYHLVFIAVLLLVPPATAKPAQAKDPIWREQVQVLYDPATRSVRRAMVRVVDPFPAQNLQFVWEPASGPGVNPQTSAAEGDGRLIWRIRGTASYDPDAVYAIFTGRLEQGRAEGRGRIVFRSGEWYEGQWHAGLRDGEGHLRDAEGNHYEGTFLAGLPHGQGKFTTPDGTVYDGPFRRGLRHGTAQIRLPGGTTFGSVWAEGVEIESDRPSLIADSMTGGLLPAQSGGMADRVVIGTAVDAQTTSEQYLAYRDRPSDGIVNIYPAHEAMVDAWNGRGTIAEWGWVQTVGNWETNKAFVDIIVGTTDGRPVSIDQMWLEVADSTSVLKPMLQVENKLGCIGYVPYFGLLNHGWGAVEAARLRFRFVTPGYFLDPGSTSSDGTRTFEVSINGFSDTAPVDVRDALAALGVDVNGLANLRFRCTRADAYDFEACLAEFKHRMNTGDLNRFIKVELQSVVTEIDGQLEFAWRGPDGSRKTATQRLSARVSLALIENMGLAEGGDAWDEGPIAPRHLDVDFSLDRRSYSIPLPYRGQTSGNRMLVQLKMRAPITSIHNFRAAVRFTDGSIRYSQPIRFFYMNPRTEVDDSALRRLDPAQCFEVEY